MKSALLSARCLLLVFILLLAGCLSSVEKDKKPVEFQVKNQVIAKILPLDRWGNDPDIAPILNVERSESILILPESALRYKEDVAVKIKEVIYQMNSRASVEIIDDKVIIKNVYESNTNSNIYAKNIVIPDTMKGVKGVMLFMAGTTWATLNTYPESPPPADKKKAGIGVKYKVCTIGITKGFEINIMHGTLGASLFSDGKELHVDMESANKPDLVDWSKCQDS